MNVPYLNPHLVNISPSFGIYGDDGFLYFLSCIRVFVCRCVFVRYWLLLLHVCILTFIFSSLFLVHLFARCLFVSRGRNGSFETLAHGESYPHQREPLGRTTINPNLCFPTSCRSCNYLSRYENELPYLS